MRSPHRVVIAGGGIAGLEALLALRALARNRVELTLVSAEEDFVYRPMAVARPFGMGHARHTPLADAARDAGATLKVAALQSVDPAARTIHTSDGDLQYDELVLAVGARSERAFTLGTTWDDHAPDEVMSGLLRDLEEGYAPSLAIVIPPGPGWPLPAYELALLIRRDAMNMGMDAKITLVTPERAPLAIFGSRAVEAISTELDAAGVFLETGAYAELSPGDTTTVHLRPGDRSFDVARVLALPRLHGRPIPGVPHDGDGFVEVDEHCRVRGIDGVWAAGDGISFPIKFGGLATQQADAAAEDIAHLAGAINEPRPFRPVLRGRLLTGGATRWMRYAAAGGEGEGQTATHALWWPPGKVAGRYLAPWLAARDDEAITSELPEHQGVAVQMDLERSF
ncbi:MAG: FAD-dependent oxidoreductase, partial [Actinomycetota bacterium]|nr:FAD-dependent oxidoreductase [Actinomycetota bacterium]